MNDRLNRDYDRWLDADRQGNDEEADAGLPRDVRAPVPPRAVPANLPPTP